MEGNPVNYIDPTGHIAEKEGIHADNINVRLQLKGVHIYKDWGYMYTGSNLIRRESCGWNIGRWNIKDLEYIDNAMKDLEKALGGSGKIQSAVGQLSINKGYIIGYLTTMMAPPNILNYFFNADILVQESATATNEEWYKFTVVHEFGHVWDYRMGIRLSFDLMKLTGGWICANWDDPYYGCYFDSSTIIEDAPDTLEICLNPATSNNSVCQKIVYSYQNTGGGAGTENWAQAFAYYVYENYRPRTIGLRPIRRQYVKKQIANLP